MRREDDDPTCVSKMLKDFKAVRAPNRLDMVSPLMTKKLSLGLDDSDDDLHIKRRRIVAEPNIGSPWDVRMLRKTVLEYKTKIATLETRVSQLHTLRKELEVVFETERSSLQQQLDKDKDYIEELKSRISQLRQLVADTREENVDKLRQLEQGKLHLDQQLQILQRKNDQLNEAMREIKITAQETQNDLKDKIAELQLSYLELQNQFAIEHETLENLKQKMSNESYGDTEKIEQITLKLKEAERKIMELENFKEESRELSDHVKKQHEKLLNLPRLEQELGNLRVENANLRDLIGNNLLLQEQVSVLQAKCASSSEREEQIIHLQANQQLLQNQINEWKAVVNDFCTTSSEQDICPDTVRHRIQELQQAELFLTADLAQAQTSLKITAQKLTQSESQISKLTREVEKLSSERDHQSGLLRRCQKRVALITGERNSYREQLDAYEKDLTVCGTIQQQQNSQLRVESLEKSLEGHRKLLEELEAELTSIRGQGGSTGFSDMLKKVTLERDELRKDKETLQKRCDDLELQMEHRVLKGDFNPAATRILHFRQNPAATADAEREDELTSLREEVSRLRERVQVLLEGEQEDITCKVDQRLAASNAQEVQELKEQIKSAELMKQRLKEAFRKTSQEFRDCIYQLLGYKVDRLQNKGGLFKLTSMYAESANDYLLFQLAGDGSMTLLETPFSASLEELIDMHLHQQHSLPMFLSAVTTGLFSRQTMITESVLGMDDDPIVLD